MTEQLRRRAESQQSRPVARELGAASSSLHLLDWWRGKNQGAHNFNTLRCYLFSLALPRPTAIEHVVFLI